MKWKVPQKKSKMERTCHAAPVLNQAPHEVVGVQLHSFLKCRKSLVKFMPRYPLHRRPSEPQSQSGRFGDRKSLPQPGIHL
jgi:hypothetical protein